MDAATLLADSLRGRWPIQNDEDAWRALSALMFQLDTLEVDTAENRAWEATMRVLVARGLSHEEHTAARMASLEERLQARKLAQSRLRYRYGFKEGLAKLVRRDLRAFVRQHRDELAAWHRYSQRMAKFSERIGRREPRSVLQIDELDEPTRNAIWNVTLRIRDHFEEAAYSGLRQQGRSIAAGMWSQHFELPLDEMGSNQTMWRRVRETILKGDSLDVLDAVDGLITRLVKVEANIVDDAVGTYNSEFEHYLVGYRFVDRELVPVTDETEVTAIEEAVGTDLPGVRLHLQRALSLLADRGNPQYAKVVHESVNAVEAAVREMTGKNVLSEGLKELERQGYNVHGALRGGWDKLYGYTSNAAGIRHAIVRDEEVDEALASYFLVTSSAFVNFLAKVKAAT
ncbi:hypothetical protein CLV49_0602 [Labedella gwakjiensis]|uniref:HEPN AbiJ-N-terminal domain-containing protein n=1 Tax=Labedella gwakjiensis TaxID=390269 RepID=A0A2P8GSQ3_9MICO|nr:hypothetical protein [Labedella gwakjiensis]PSL36999.1 hypothetical protein CLV49_0602 [Labedella gwakjiensis]RUQ81842.1 hypothetical protein ELQ93_17595 [Labedella gwakjiensis]